MDAYHLFCCSIYESCRDCPFGTENGCAGNTKETKMKTIIADTRNQVDDFVVEGLREMGYKVLRSALPFGDFAYKDNISYAVDIKSSGGGLVELAKNVCSSDHGRLKREIMKTQEWEGQLCFLVCNNEGIMSIEDVARWQVPRFKADSYLYRWMGELLTKKQLLGRGCFKLPEDFNGDEKILKHKRGDLMTQVKPETLVKALRTMSEPNHYGQGMTVKFAFCSKETAACKIVQILDNYERMGGKK